jgi:cytochrome d ubiquinol oxidase subunit II
MLVDQLAIDDAAGASTTLGALLVVVALAVILVLPGLLYLFKMSQSEPTIGPVVYPLSDR